MTRDLCPGLKKGRIGGVAVTRAASASRREAAAARTSATMTEAFHRKGWLVAAGQLAPAKQLAQDFGYSRTAMRSVLQRSQVRRYSRRRGREIGLSHSDERYDEDVGAFRHCFGQFIHPRIWALRIAG